MPIDELALRNKIQEIVTKRIRDPLEVVTPKRTGTLAKSWIVIFPSPNSYDIEVINPSGNIIKWLDEGTGIYGPRKKLIRPINAQVLHWIDQSGKDHFAQWVRGIEPREFIKLVVNQENIDGVFREIREYVQQAFKDAINQDTKDDENVKPKP